jgi:hypothetical protein
MFTFQINKVLLFVHFQLSGRNSHPVTVTSTADVFFSAHFHLAGPNSCPESTPAVPKVVHTPKGGLTV